MDAFIFLFVALLMAVQFGMVLLMGAAPVILTSRKARMQRGQGGWKETIDCPFWCWQTVAVYMVVLGIAGGILTLGDLAPHDHPIPFLVYGLSLGLGLTLWDRWRTRRHGRPKRRQGA